MNTAIHNILYNTSSSSMAPEFGTFFNDSGSIITVRNHSNQIYLYNKSSNRFVDHNMNPIHNNQIPNGYYYNSKNIPVVLKTDENITYKSTGVSISTK